MARIDDARRFYTIDNVRVTRFCRHLKLPDAQHAPPRPMNEPLVHRTLSAAIVEKLRLAILDGSYPAGAQLRQDALAEAYRVSRIPVREALFQLEAEGLVRIEPHKGAVVSAFSREEIDDVFDLRVLLEPRLLAASVPRMDRADLEAAAALDAAFAHAVQAGEVARWGELNARFHLSLYRHAPRPRSLAIVTALLQTSDRFTRLQMNRTPAMTRARSEHHRLLALCRERRLDAACDHLAAHIEKVRRDLHRLFRRAAGAPAPTGERVPGAAAAGGSA